MSENPSAADASNTRTNTPCPACGGPHTFSECWTQDPHVQADLAFYAEDQRIRL